MKKTLKSIYFIFGLLIFTLIFATGFYFAREKRVKQEEKINYAKNKEEIEVKNQEEIKKALQTSEDDFIYGDKSAKVKIISYDAFSCHHCASFYEQTFPDLEEKYIKTGKVLFIHRNFPIDAASLVATKGFDCFVANNKENPALSVQLIKNIFERQGSWSFNDSGHDDLYKSFKSLNFPKDKFDACMADKNLEDKILQKRLYTANVLGINATPKFFINGKTYSKGYLKEPLFEAIEAELANNN